MAKPRLIIIVRHAQSEGNKNREIHQTVPDHRVKLTTEGWQQAYEAGRRMRDMLRADDTLQFFTSPYRRTRETTEGILETLTSDDPEPSPFKRNNIKVYEEPRLREQDFGNFQPCSAEMERMWQERADYGHFFYRIPNGESAADAYDRVSGFNESLWRQFGEDDFPSVCVLVTHGLMSRVFLMKWYHFSVEYFEDLRNINHCEFLIMRKQEDSGKYQLENKLRTWSELRRERAALLKQKEQDSNSAAKDKDAPKPDKAASLVTSPSTISIVPQRRWGGCPDGCNHDKNFKIRSGFADLLKHDGTAFYNESNSGSGSSKSPSSPTHGHSSPSHGSHGNHGSSTSVAHLAPSLSRRSTASRRFQSVGYSDDDDDNADGGDEIDDDNRASSPASENSSQSGQQDGTTIKVAASKSARIANRAEDGSAARSHADVTRSREDIVSSSDATPSFIAPEDRLRMQTQPPGPKSNFLHVGRDFGGTYSGHTSDADSSEDDRVRQRMARLKLHTAVTNSNDEGDHHKHQHQHQHQHHKSHTSPSSVIAEDPNFYGTGNSAPGRDGTTTNKSSRSGPGNNSSTATSNSGNGISKSASSPILRRRRTKNMANRLGDAPHCSECEHSDTGLTEDEMDMDDDLMASGIGDDDTDVDHELRREEEEDRSIRGSVY